MPGVFGTFRPLGFVCNGPSAGIAEFMDVDIRMRISSVALKTLLGRKGAPATC